MRAGAWDFEVMDRIIRFVKYSDKGVGIIRRLKTCPHPAIKSQHFHPSGVTHNNSMKRQVSLLTVLAFATSAGATPLNTQSSTAKRTPRVARTVQTFEQVAQKKESTAVRMCWDEKTAILD